MNPNKQVTHMDTLKESVNVSIKKSKKPKCHFCNKKLKMTELSFICKCKYTFCQLHLNPHSHKCSFNYLEHKQSEIKLKNPKMCIQSIEVK
jgi:hypothetical protein